MKIALVAGEASGDLLGATLIQTLQTRYPNAQFEGIGGSAMMAAGCNSLFDIERLAVMGLIEPLFRLPDLIKLRYDLYHYFNNHRPDIFIGIDAPDFNMGLEHKLRRLGIPVVHYVSPSVWAWRQKRVHKIAKAVDLMLTLFPFEAKFYEQHGVPVHYVGHPLARQIPLVPDKGAARRALCLDNEAIYIALLPGSRRQEIRQLAEPLLVAAYKAWQQRPNLRFVTAHVNEARYKEFHLYCQQFAPHLPIEFFTRRAQDVMAAADVAVVASGTATLETMLFKTPMIIAYRMSRLTFQLAKYLVKTPFVGLPNLLADKMLVPELIQDAVQPDAIVKAIFAYLDAPDKNTMLLDAFTVLHKALRAEKAACTADVIGDLLKKKG